MNIPQLRFPEFKGEWEKKKIGDIGEVKMCKRIFAEETQPFGKIPFFKIGSFGKEPDAFISEELYNDYKKRFSFPKKGDILISAAGTIGRTVVYDGQDAYYQDSNIVWIDNNNDTVSNEFLYYIYQIVKFNTEGGTIQRLYNNILRSTEFYKPTPKEQTKIASFLTAVDVKIQTLKKKQSLLEQYKKGVMQKLFSQELRFKDENGNDFPEWEEKMLGEVLIKNSTKNKKQKYSLVQSVSNKHGFINQDEMFEDRRVASKDTSNYYVIEKGHFAYNPSRIDVGSLAYKYDDEISVISPLYISFRANHKYVSDAYLLNWFSSEQFIKQMNGSFEGSVRNTLSYESLIKMSISLPKEKEQEKISSFLIEIEKRIKISENEIHKLETWKKGLLQKMFC